MQIILYCKLALSASHPATWLDSGLGAGERGTKDILDKTRLFDRVEIANLQKN